MKNQMITLSEFSYTTKDGGTGLSAWDRDGEIYSKPIKGVVIKLWTDYETGIRGWMIPDTNDKKLMSFLERNAMIGDPNPEYYRGNFDAAKTIDTKRYVLFFSQFEVLSDLVYDQSVWIHDNEDL